MFMNKPYIAILIFIYFTLHSVSFYKLQRFIPCFYIVILFLSFLCRFESTLKSDIKIYGNKITMYVYIHIYALSLLKHHNTLNITQNCWM